MKREISLSAYHSSLCHRFMQCNFATNDTTSCRLKFLKPQSEELSNNNMLMEMMPSDLKMIFWFHFHKCDMLTIGFPL